MAAALPHTGYCDELLTSLRVYRGHRSCPQQHAGVAAESWLRSAASSALQLGTLSSSKLAKLEQRRARRGLGPARDAELPLVAKRSPLCCRVRLLLAFRGSGFHGWTRQPNLRTLQSELEDVTRALFQQRVRLVPAGRTDAGVHAVGQVCQFDVVLGGLPAGRLPQLLNAQLPDDLRVLGASVSDPSFNVMVTQWKRYVYRIPTLGVEPCGLLEFCSSVSRAPVGKLNVAAMREASVVLTGTHDFAAFQSSRGRQSTVRTLLRCTVLEEEDTLALVMEADGFLMHMCRILAGTLLQVGTGIFKPEDLCSILESRDRQRAGPTLPAAGLCLEHVEHNCPWSPEGSQELAVTVSWPVLPGSATKL